MDNISGSGKRVIKSYVWHGDKCFFVSTSTIERNSSAALGPRRYSETLVWEYDWEKGTRGEIIHQDEDIWGSIGTHQYVCNELFEMGEVKEYEDEKD